MHHMQPHFVKAERIDPAFLPPSYHLQQQQLQLQRQQQQQQHAQHHSQHQLAQNGAPARNSVLPESQHKQGGQEDSQNVESQPDFPSIKGIFGWTTLDNVNIPYILRHDKKFVSVRIVEQKLLSKYPNSYPDDLGKHAPLTSFFITTNEAKLLNEINLHHCAAEYGKKEFTTKDLIVLLSDFTKFYDLVKKTFPDPKSARDAEISSAGWLQIKNTVTPYIKRVDGKYVPLSVIQYAAGLLIGTHVAGVDPTAKECELLNEACKTAGVEFVFSETTRLIKVSDIQKVTQVEVIVLPNSNPLKHATYMELPTTSNVQVTDKPRTGSSMAASQKAQQPYRFQPSSQMENIRNVLQGKMTSPDIGFDRFPLGLPGPPMDPKLAALYQLPLPGQLPFLPGQGIRPPPYPAAVPPNMINALNPMMQYYLGMHNTNSQKVPAQGPPNKVVSSQPLPGLVNEFGQSRSPGASSSNPSPRSRPPSLSRPGSGSRPPSETPLSPTSPSHVPGRSPPFALNPDTLPISLAGTSLQQMQNMYAQRFPGPSLPPALIPASRNPGITQPTPAESAPKVREILQSPTFVSGQLSKSANQEIPGLFSPTGTSVAPPKPQQVKKVPTTDIGAPPPLLLMSNPLLSPPPPSQPKNDSNAGRGVVIETPESSVPTTPTLPAPVLPASPTLDDLIPQPVSVVKQTPKDTYTAKIKGAWLNSKSISCLHLDSEDRSGRYCLVEAVCKLYFNGCSVNEFLFALENVLNVQLLTCNDVEEKAFIQYYSLPVDVLKCNKMIKFDDLENFFPQLSYMFPDKNSQELALAAESEETIVHDVNLSQENNNVSKVVTNGGLTEAELEAAMPGVMADMMPHAGQKRPGDSIDPSSPKQSRIDNSKPIMEFLSYCLTLSLF